MYILMAWLHLWGLLKARSTRRNWALSSAFVGMRCSIADIEQWAQLLQFLPLDGS